MCGKNNMNDSLFDDVNSLLDGDFGDDRILKQIARACKNNEVISNYERNYVQKLAEQYLGKAPEITKAPKITKAPEITPSQTPDVTTSKIISSIQPQTFQSQPSIRSKSILKNSKLLLGFGGVAMVIIAAVIILSLSNSDSFLNDGKSEIKSTLTIQTDLSSYGKNDLISINGISHNSKVVNLSIKNQNNELVWAEQISVKNNNLYSTLVISGGPGWDTSGTYTLKTDNGSETKSIKFSFTS